MQDYTRNDVATAISLVGTLTAIALALSLGPKELSDFGLNGFWLVFISEPSAWIAGKLCGSMFGHQGLGGWVLAAIGALLSTVAGAMIAGTFVFPGLGTMFAPLILFAVGVEEPMIWITWLICMTGLQIILLKSVDNAVDAD
ncbi:hypothetical protein L0664_04080 [Octadecabacter sp. G9-8]|uniref:HPP family protein n=1 Tax=Octadecabacter dasysiphoniae TaxID=2909341 RepID=A0ABS9CTF6_9RHOB|nr:hypothetical protein [Octadecabacter dasysiphoniae]MCF2870236.1 hypothetical protein [Octadecabacter dasysiphoniae]